MLLSTHSGKPPKGAPLLAPFPKSYLHPHGEQTRRDPIAFRRERTCPGNLHRLLTDLSLLARRASPPTPAKDAPRYPGRGLGRYPFRCLVIRTSPPTPFSAGLRIPLRQGCPTARSRPVPSKSLRGKRNAKQPQETLASPRI